MARNRLLTIYESRKHGCQYCLHVTTMRHDGKVRNACPFRKCQFEVLDKYKSYEEFMASEDSKILVTEFFTSFAGCYEHASCEHTPKRIYSDGDSRIHL